MARAKDVRAALVLVERGECPLGQVYATDAAISGKVRVAGFFPKTVIPHCLPGSLVKQRTDVLKRSGPAARSFLDFLRSEAAVRVFETYGFSVR